MRQELESRGIIGSLTREDYMNWKKLITLDNQFQADLLTDALGKAEIPFLVREYKDTAYDGLFVTQKGWGTVMVEETSLEEAKVIAEELLET
jgi:hypothetical protein